MRQQFMMTFKNKCARRSLGTMALFGILTFAQSPEPVWAQRGGFDRGGMSGGFSGFSSRGGPGGGSSGTMRVLMDEKQRGELNLTADQLTALEGIREKIQPDPSMFGDMFSRMRDASDEERIAMREEMTKKFQDLAKQAEDEVAKVLDEKQYKRLKQLGLRSSGPRAMTEEETAKKLDLTDEQKTKMNALIEEASNASRSGGFSRQSSEERDRQRAELEAKLLEILNSDQKEKWTKMLGDPPAGSTASPSSTPVTSAPIAPASNDLDALAKELDSLAPVAVTPPSGPSVVDFGVAQDVLDALPSDGVETMSFNFRNAPWSDVLMLFAKVSGLTLDLNVIPPGYFSYYDTRSYSPREALDVLNGYLIQRGYVLVQRDRFLVCANISEGVPASLVPTVDEAALPNRGRNEFVRVILNTGDLDAASVKDDLLKLISYKGDVTALTKSNQVIVTATASDAMRIQALLEKSRPSGDGVLSFESFTLQHVAAAEAEPIVRTLLGIDKSLESSSRSSSSGRSMFEEMIRQRMGGGGDDRSRGGSSGGSSSSTQTTPTARVTIDERTNTLLVSAKSAELLIVRQAIEQLDVPLVGGQQENWQDRTKTKVRVVPVKNGDLGDVAKTVQMMIPGIVINEDNDIDVLHIIGPESKQQEAAELIRLLDSTGGGNTVAVIELNRMDAYSASLALSNMFVSEGRDAPAIQSDPDGRSLMVRGTIEQVAQVKALLVQLGETGQVQDRREQSRGPIRRIPLGGQDAESMARMIEELWNRSHSQKVRVLGGSESGQPFVEPQTPASSPEQSNFETSIRPQHPLAVQLASQQSETPVTKPAPSISIAIVGGELVISSQDEQLLNEMEDLMAQILSKSADQVQWSLYYLRNSDALTVSSMLTDFFPTATVVGSPTISSYSSSSRYGSSTYTPISPVNTQQTLKVIPDTRTNSLFISGPSQMMAEVEQLLKILDVSEFPGVQADRLPRMIPVFYADIEMVSQIVQDTFRDSLYEAPQQRGGSSEERGRAAPSGPSLYADRVTVAVDVMTSQLIVSCNDQIYSQIQTLVKTLDDAARDAKRTVRIVGLENTDAAMVQQTLGALLPKVNVSTTRTSVSSSSSGRPSGESSSRDSSSRESSSRSSGSSDDFRAMMEQRMRERMSSGGGDSGRSGFGGFGGGPPSGFGGFGGSSRSSSSDRGSRGGR